MLSNRVRCLLAGVFALPLLGFSSPPANGQEPPTKIRFQLDWRFDGQAGPFLLAAGKGYFKAENLDVQLDVGAGSALAVTRVASTSYDMGYGDTSALIEFVANNSQDPAVRVQAIYMVLGYTPAAVMVMKRSNVVKPADLAGKTIAAPPADAARKLFPLFARQVGVDPSTIKWQSVDGVLREQLMVRGQVDGITGFQPSGMLAAIALGAKQEDLVIFNYKDHGAQVYGNAILVNPAFVRQNPKAVAAFLRAYNRGLKETIANPEEAIPYVKRADPLVDSDLELRRLKGQLDQFVVTPAAKSDGLGGVDRARLEMQIREVAKIFNLPVSPKPEDIFNPSFLPGAGERRL